MLKLYSTIFNVWINQKFDGNFCKNWSYWSRSFCRPHLDFSNCLNIRRSI